MFKIEVIVTTSTRTELKLTADWPLIWLQDPGWIEIERILLPGEIVPRIHDFVKRSALPVNREPLWNMKLGDRALVRCFLKGESLKLTPPSPDVNLGNVIDCSEFFDGRAIAAKESVNRFALPSWHRSAWE
jgi:hypothetical protein